MSTLRVTTISNIDSTKSATAANVIDGASKAWVNFNGSGTVAIRTSLNVSSITDDGVGCYQINFTTAFSDANYLAFGSSSDTSGIVYVNLVAAGGGTYQAPTTSSFKILINNASNTGQIDPGIVAILVHR